MATILKSIKFPGLPDTYTVPGVNAVELTDYAAGLALGTSVNVDSDAPLDVWRRVRTSLNAGSPVVTPATYNRETVLLVAEAAYTDDSGRCVRYAPIHSNGVELRPVISIVTSGTTFSAVTATLVPLSWSGTQAEYDALGSYDSGTVYYILEAEA